MLFVTYWELNQNSSVAERLTAAQRIMEAGQFPPEGVKMLRWDVTTDDWGVLICEADSVAAIERSLAVWRTAMPGFFACTRTAPAMPVQEAMPLIGEILKSGRG